jgi:hypothetical protein
MAAGTPAGRIMYIKARAVTCVHPEDLMVISAAISFACCK